MRVRIHRGAHEIGGSCVEVEAAGKRLVLDVGRPLTAERDEVVPLPAVKGFAGPDAGLAGVVITHAHQDHWGLADQLPEGTPLFIGKATASILETAAFWTTGLTRPATAHLSHRVPMEMGPFTVTPYLNDHSAFDAYSLLVQAEGRSLFYTGDIRAHGRRRGIFYELLRKPPLPVDVLLMEGTNIRAAAEPEMPGLSETDVEQDALETIRATSGMTMVCFSAQNIDRLVTLFRAARRAGRTLVMDLYTADVAQATGNQNIPQPGPEWPDVKVFVPQWQRVKLKQTERFDKVEAIRPYRLFPEALAAGAGKYVVKVDGGSVRHLADKGALEGASLIWSLWSGYLKEGSGLALKEFLTEAGIPMVQHHTSGHAFVKDLQKLAKALNPTRLVPIHTFGSARFEELFENVSVQPDGAWWEV